jgi:hypothetical protein
MMIMMMMHMVAAGVVVVVVVYDSGVVGRSAFMSINRPHSQTLYIMHVLCCAM